MPVQHCHLFVTRYCDLFITQFAEETEQCGDWVTEYKYEESGSIPGRGENFLSSPNHQEWF
jgi:hypothetical protein